MFYARFIGLKNLHYALGFIVGKFVVIYSTVCCYLLLCFFFFLLLLSLDFRKILGRRIWKRISQSKTTTATMMKEEVEEERVYLFFKNAEFDTVNFLVSISFFLFFNTESNLKLQYYFFLVFCLLLLNFTFIWFFLFRPFFFAFSSSC